MTLIQALACWSISSTASECSHTRSSYLAHRIIWSECASLPHSCYIFIRLWASCISSWYGCFFDAFAFCLLALANFSYFPRRWTSSSPAASLVFPPFSWILACRSRLLSLTINSLLVRLPAIPGAWLFAATWPFLVSNGRICCCLWEFSTSLDCLCQAVLPGYRRIGRTTIPKAW